jgi:endonuclease/exonuclease/phosphatase family metal-dependent hydrolase
LAGDFNIYRYAHEKSNDNIAWADIETFNDWINEMELMEIEICNSRYTWSNMRRDPTLVKLDRVLVNLQWGQKFLHSECKTLARPTSDHKPLLLDMAVPQIKSDIFRYDDHWFICSDLVQKTKHILTKETR